MMASGRDTLPRKVFRNPEDILKFIDDIQSDFEDSEEEEGNL